MEVTNEAILAEIDTELKTTDSGLDLLTGTSSTEPLVGNSIGDLTTENLAFTLIDSSKILEVTGRGVVAVDADIAQVRVGVEVEGATASEVQQQVAQSLSAVVEQLNQLEVTELQTISVSLRPQLEFDNSGNSTVVGFTGRNVLQFEIPTEQAGATIDAAIEAGANLIENISFIATEDALSQARLEAIKLAALDAQNLAMPLFDTLELTPLEILDIDIIGVNNPSPRPFSAQLELAAFDASTPIIGGTQDIVAEVALDISYAEL